MDFWATLRVIVRRWYVVLPVLALSLFGAAMVYTSVPTTYESRAVILLTTPPTGSVSYANGYRPDEVNPLLNPNNGLDLTGTMLIESMRTPDFATAIGMPGDGSATLTVNNGTDNPELLINGPFVYVTVDSPDPRVPTALVTRAVAAAHDVLRQRQAEVHAPPTTFVEFTDVVSPTPEAPMRGNRLRATAAALALGLIATLAATFATESVMRRPWRPSPRPAAPQRGGPTDVVAGRRAAPPVELAHTNGAGTGPGDRHG